MSERAIHIEPLTRQAFQPFGQVIEVEGATHFPINKGNTERFDDLAAIEFVGAEARPNLSIFRGKPFSLPHILRTMERHPFGSQAFYPLSTQPFLVTVAPDENGVPGMPRAFLTGPGQGINIAMNVWHGSLTPLGTISDFLVVDRIGEGVNLKEHDFDEPWLILPGA